MKTNKHWLLATLLLFITSANAQQTEVASMAATPETTKINLLTAELTQSAALIERQKLKIAILSDDLADVQLALTQAQSPEEMSVAGFSMPASNYTSALTFVSIFLFLVAAVFAVRVRQANYIMRKSTEALANLEEEHEEHLRISLEREQKLRRQLQDEINRHKIQQAS